MDANSAKAFSFEIFKNKVVLIPYWIHETLMRNNLPIDRCLYLNSVVPLVALNDLACFISLNDHLDRLLWGDVNKPNNVEDCAVSTNIFLMIEGIYKPSSENYKYFYETLVPYANDKSIKTEIENRLFSSESKLDNYDEPYKAYDLGNGTCGIVVYPGIGDRINSSEVQKSLVDSILKVFYVYSTPDKVASSAIFYRYLKLLENK